MDKKYNKIWEGDFFLKNGISYSTYSRNKDREKFRSYCREQATCECGKSCRRGYLSEHRQTKKHLDILAKNPLPLITDLSTTL